MGIRTAIEHNPLVTAGLLFAIGWTVVIGARIVDQMGPIVGGNWVGQNGLGGLMGLLIIVAFLGLLIASFGALGEPNPAPKEWPPE
ncbi:hypothetical protein [Haloterrigena salifodinae]|uniref:hypothetical protein n=1 Tax=Haloterrigena salifodinae TaxID=2675099 RepID=UPI000F86696A|nr:hypothetical protein [Haloterrigena salifodinae]